MAAFGMMEVLLLLLIGAGTAPDVVAAIDPESYFQARQIDVTIAKLADLAAQEPKTASAQIKQLLALRYLALNPDKLKKADRYADHRKTLEAIADGKQAQDAQGFAKEYAQGVLARLDNKPLPVPPAPKLREDALAWFPENATVVAAFDARVARNGSGPGNAISDLFKKMPAAQMKMIFDIIDQTGNVRLDRIAFAFVHDENKDKSRMYFRITGKGNSVWLLAALKDKAPEVQVSERKDAAGQTIKEVNFGANAPPALLIGDREFIMAGSAGREQNGDADAEMLAIRAGKKPSVMSGPFKARLRKVPDRAVALLVGDIPAPLGMELQRAFGAAPTKIDAFIEALVPGFDVNVTGTMATPDDAQAAVMKLAQLRKDGIMALQALQKQPNANPQLPVNALINLIESLQMQGEGNAVRLRVLIPRNILQGLPGFLPF